MFCTHVARLAEGAAGRGSYAELLALLEGCPGLGVVVLQPAEHHLPQLRLRQDGDVEQREDLFVLDVLVVFRVAFVHYAQHLLLHANLLRDRPDVAPPSGEVEELLRLCEALQPDVERRSAEVDVVLPRRQHDAQVPGVAEAGGRLVESDQALDRLDLARLERREGPVALQDARLRPEGRLEGRLARQDPLVPERRQSDLRHDVVADLWVLDLQRYLETTRG